MKGHSSLELAMEIKKKYENDSFLFFYKFFSCVLDFFYEYFCAQKKRILPKTMAVTSYKA